MDNSSPQNAGCRGLKTLVVVALFHLIGFPLLYFFLIRPMWNDYSALRAKAELGKDGPSSVERNSLEDDRAGSRVETAALSSLRTLRAKLGRLKLDSEIEMAWNNEPDRLGLFLRIVPTNATEKLLKELAEFRVNLAASHSLRVEELIERALSEERPAVVAMSRTMSLEDRDRVWIQEAKRLADGFPKEQTKDGTSMTYLALVEAMTVAARDRVAELRK